VLLANLPAHEGLVLLLQSNHWINQTIAMQIKIFRIYITLLIFFSNLFFVFNVTAQHKNERFIDSLINHHLQQSKMAGLAGAVIVNNQIVWMKGYGYADIGNKIRFTPNTIMNTGSLSPAHA
jgi:CubicO group peptidase (beta-lactamase class C family)